MLRLTKKLTLAVEAVVDIACNGVGQPVQSQDIAQRLGLPKRYLEQVMQQLVRAGLLKGVRGPRGGYRLAREQRRISVGDVFRVVRGDDGEDEFALGSTSDLGQRVMVPFWTQLEEEFMHRLDSVTIDELCRRAMSVGVERVHQPAADFAI
jgi:Rrf2 family transcriptional regulator, iron-sulfur cluster assembly transcription factor